MININKKILKIVIPSALIGGLFIVVGVNLMVEYAIRRIVSSMPIEHTHVISSSVYFLGIFFLILVMMMIFVYIWVVVSKLKKMIKQDFNKYLLALENASNHIIITDPDGLIVYANKGAEKLTGYKFEEMIGNTPRLWGGLMSPEHYQKVWQTIKYDRQTYYGEIKNRKKSQDEYDVIMRISPIIDEHKQLTGFVATEEDITERKQREEELKKTNWLPSICWKI